MTHEEMRLYAELLIKACGFKHVKTSVNSNSTYYATEGATGVLRLSCHKNKRPMGFEKQQPVLSRVTMSEKQRVSEELAQHHVEQTVAKAVGVYLMKVGGVKLYGGKE